MPENIDPSKQRAVANLVDGKHVHPTHLSTTNVLQQFMERRRTITEALASKGVTEEHVAGVIADAMGAKKAATDKDTGEWYETDVPDWRTRMAAAKLAADALGMTGSAAQLDLKIHAHLHQVGSDREAMAEVVNARERDIGRSLIRVIGPITTDVLNAMTTKDRARWLAEVSRVRREGGEYPEWRDYVFTDAHPEGRKVRYVPGSHLPAQGVKDDPRVLNVSWNDLREVVIGEDEDGS